MNEDLNFNYLLHYRECNRANCRSEAVKRNSNIYGIMLSKWEENDTNLFGVQYVEPQNLKSYEYLVVVTYVTNDLEIRQQLNEMGIHKVINSFDIFNIFD